MQRDILWLPFAALGAFRRRRRIKRGLCPKCAYDLRGSDSRTCPECGKATKEAPGSDNAKTKPLLMILLSVAALVVAPLAGCATESQPPWPPALTPSWYVPPIQDRDVPPDCMFYSVAGLRAADHGLYVDLFVQSEADASLLQRRSAVIAQAVSLGSEHGRWIEIRDANGDDVELKPLKYPNPGFGQTVKWAAPGNVLVKQEEHRTILVQTLLFRTPSQCKGQAYTVHLTDRWNEILSEDAPFHIITASEWRQVPLINQPEAAGTERQ